MAQVRVIIYREQSDTVLEDIVVTDPDRNSGNLATVVVNRLSEVDGMTVDFTDEFIENGGVI